MTPDEQEIFEDMLLADSLKAAAPGSGVSADALFAELRRMRQPRGWRHPGAPPEPPAWFQQQVSSLRGRALTIGEILLLAGREDANKRERNEVGGGWDFLRASTEARHCSTSDHQKRNSPGSCYRDYSCCQLSTATLTLMVNKFASASMRCEVP